MLNQRIAIYIPLCFYYIDGDILYNRSSQFIYIPLCFYYILNQYEPFGVSSSFTFHYVSITSIQKIENRIQSTEFTFHYVSITSIDRRRVDVIET